MAELASFETVYADVSNDLASAFDGRGKAGKSFKVRLVIGLTATAVLTVLLLATKLWPYAAVFGLIITFWWANKPMSKIAANVKAPVLSAVAQRSGLTYQAASFVPRGFYDAQRELFPHTNTPTFTDCFSGELEGRPFSIYEADIDRSVQDNTQQVFLGQIYSITRRAPFDGEIVIAPDKGIFNAFKPAKGLQQVHFDDKAFEKRFQAYATDPAAAAALLNGPVRQKLLEWRGDESLFARIAGTEALVAVPGKNLFEPVMKKNATAEDSARHMYEDVQACLRRLSEIDAALS